MLRYEDSKNEDLVKRIDELMMRVEKRKIIDHLGNLQYVDDRASIIDLLEVGSMRDELHRRGERRRTATIRDLTWAIAVLTAVMTLLTFIVARASPNAFRFHPLTEHALPPVSVPSPAPLIPRSLLHWRTGCGGF